MRLPALALALTLAAAMPAFASEEVTARATVGGDRFVAGGSVRQSTPVDGDMFGVGGNVDLVATVKGDAVLGGGDVRVREPVKQDLYVGGGNVRIEAPVGGNARLAGGNVEVSAEGSVKGNLSVAGGTIEVRGPVAGHIQAAGGDVLVDSAVGGNVRVAAGQLTLGPNARIAGRVIMRGAERIRQDPAAEVAGGVTREPARAREIHRDSWTGMSWAWTLGLVALAAFIAGVFPTGSRQMGDTLRADPAMAFLLGFITLVCVPVAALMLMITIIGIPLGIVVLMLYGVMLIVGYAALAVVVGDAALARLRTRDAAVLRWRVGAAAAAMLGLALLGKSPYLGGLVIFAAILAGIGAAVLLFRTQAAPA